jgi:hypothetical protein
MSDTESNISDTENIDADSEYITEIKADVDVVDADFMDIIKQEHDPQKNRLAAIYGIVERYLRDNKCILVGGMAIDIMLRAKGSRLYTTSKIDYDFISDTFHTDAYKIAKMVAENTSAKSTHVINAMHTSTMRVRYRYTYLADSTYVPSVMYKLVPTIDADGLTIAHPCYQMLDQHLALSQPYAGSPLDNVLGKRWKHDITRYELLADYYDIPAEMLAIEKKKKLNGKYITDEKIKALNGKLQTIKLADIADCCIAGYGAYAYWMDKIKPKSMTFTIDEKKQEVVYTPTIGHITLLSNDISKLLEDNATVKYYNAILDKLHRRVVTSTYEILDVSGNFISAHKISDKHNVYVAGIQHTMLYLGVRAMFFDDPNAATAYIHLHKAFMKGIQNADPTFVYSLEYYGTFNQTDNERILLKKQCAYMNSQKISIDIPAHYYPANTETFPVFDPTRSAEYKLDGQECEPFLSRGGCIKECVDIIGKQ